MGNHTLAESCQKSCPPGEAYAKVFGLTYRLFSSAEIDWVYQRNLRFLEDYLRFSRAPFETEVSTAIRTLVQSQPALSLLELLEGLQRGLGNGNPPAIQ